jgi:hypothetical protein
LREDQSAKRAREGAGYEAQEADWP